MTIIFREVVKSDEFLSLSSEDVVKIISCNDLAVPFEENVRNCNISNNYCMEINITQRAYILM